MNEIRIEVWLAAGYSVFLVTVAAVLERLALGCHRRGHRLHTFGFTYRREVDAWQCPAQQFLTRRTIENERKLVVYEAPARACNGCALKPHCTSSDSGREIVAPPDNWLQTRIGRFHRGLSLSLCVLAGFLLTVEFVRCHGSAEHVLLAAVVVLITAFAKRLAVELRPTSAS